MSWHEWLFMLELDDGGFGSPGYLWWLFTVPVLAAVLIGMGWVHTRRLKRLFRGDLVHKVLPRSVRVRRTIRDVLLLVALTCGIFALAGPRYGKEVHITKQKGVDLVLVIDLSRSMKAQDVDPSRIERVRREVVDLLDMMGSDRVGLVIFAGGAYARMPLTRDHQALRQLVDEMTTDDFQIQGSAIGEAIRVGTKLLSNDEASTAGKAMLILSDGEVHNPSGGLTAASEARDAGVRIYTMGVGREAAPIPLGNGVWQLDNDGRRVLSTPSPEYLKEIARIGGGAYGDSTPSDNDMRRLYREGIRKSVQSGLVGNRTTVRWKKAYQWPLGIGLFAALFAVWLGDGHRKWGLAVAILLAVGLTWSAPALADSVADGDQAFRTSKFQEAERIFTELTYDQPNNPDLYRRLGAARYRAGDFEGAARAWERQASLEGDESSDSLYNAGNAHARAGR
ncbi:MAG: Ca-activated chloride channel family protein, partial [Kiritimatiellia bacterium]